ncbi:pollen-specific leucine-rich repeat extensin-like protein 1 isoform X2 [Drosophila eugracilis]|uniref:pollen-specific leucine-rich repeat extensin-like protein 1 isoform X2 n=1 Tax=Drosophila eugracilis TaxID=29029 RepID=UPI0007E8A741|nr:pollen-specific leucine-rich repeat extensin-like protein 1 isoform X2 [Drosophila eugracilis]
MGSLLCSQQQFGLLVQAVNMKSVIILLALVAYCHAAPLDVKESSSETLSRPSPISPDVIVDPKPTAKVVLLKDTPVLNREKRHEPEKPDSVKAHEQIQPNPHAQKPTPASPHDQKPSPVSTHDAKPQDHSHKHKREAHHEEGHTKVPKKEEVKDAPEVPEPKKEKRETEPKPEDPVEKKKEKREAHHEEGHKDDDKPQVEDLSLPHAVPTDAHTAQLPKKQEKRETVEKPDSVKARESLQHSPQHADELHKAIESLGAKVPEQRHQRDIPVPTQTKATTEPSTTKSETGSTTPSTHLNIPHPIPVAELFEKNKHADKSSSSSEESKEKAKA